MIGKAFLYKVLRAIADSTFKLDDDLMNLLKLGFIGEQSRDPELTYIFRHAVIQEVTYESVLRAKRKQIHEKVGETLENLFPGNIEEMCGVLAYHFGRAEKWDKAQEYLFRAAAKSDCLAADAEALYHYQQAVTACTNAFGQKLDPAQRAMVERKLGEAYFRRGEHEKAFYHFERALVSLGIEFVPRRGPVRGRLLREILVQGLRFMGLSRFWHRPDPAFADRLPIYQMMCWMFLFDDPERLLLCLLTILNESEKAQHAEGTAFAASYLVYFCDLAGLTRLGPAYLRKAGAAAKHCENPIARCNVELGSAWHFLYAANPASALESFGTAASLGWQCGDLRAFGSATFGESLLAVQQGQLAKAWALALKHLKVGQESADQVAIRSGLLLKGLILGRTGRWHESEATLREGLSAAESARDYLLIPLAASELGRCLVRQGQLAEAGAVLSEARQTVSARGLRGQTVAMLLNAIAEYHLISASQLSEMDRKHELVKAKNACWAALRAAKGFPGAYPEAMRHCGECDWLMGEKQKAASRWNIAAARAAQLGSAYDQAMIDLTMGRLTGNENAAARGRAAMAGVLKNVFVEDCEI